MKKYKTAISQVKQIETHCSHIIFPPLLSMVSAFGLQAPLCAIVKACLVGILKMKLK